MEGFGKGALPLTTKTAPKTNKTLAKKPSAMKPPPKAKTKAKAQPKGLEELILARLDDDKAQDVVFIDIKGKSPVADGLVVASGRSARHVVAMADHLLRSLKDAGLGKVRIEGLPHGDWVLIDAGDVIVHLFRPEVRAFYNIEKIWSVEPPKAAAS
jgi:ribosome-associated protein